MKKITSVMMAAMLSVFGAQATILQNWQYNDAAGTLTKNAVNTGTPGDVNLAAGGVNASGTNNVINGTGLAIHTGTYVSRTVAMPTPITSGTVYVRVDYANWSLTSSDSSPVLTEMGFQDSAGKQVFQRLSKGKSSAAKPDNVTVAAILGNPGAATNTYYGNAGLDMGMIDSTGISVILGIDLTAQTYALWTDYGFTGTYTQKVDKALEVAIGNLTQFRYSMGGNAGNVKALDMVVVGTDFNEVATYTIPTVLTVEGGTLIKGNMKISTGTNGLAAAAGAAFALQVGEPAVGRAGVAYSTLAGAGLGETIQAGTYTMVMRVATSSDTNTWYGARDMLAKGVSGFGGGFMLSNPTNGAFGQDAIHSMVDFNKTNGVFWSALPSLASPSNIVAATVPTAGVFSQDTWYDVTNTWVVAADSPAVGQVAWVGVCSHLLSGYLGNVCLDDALLAFEPLGSDPATMLYGEWTGTFPTLGAATNLTDNPDGDALDNLAEYALGGNPTNGADVGHLPYEAVVAAGGTNWLYHVHAERKDAAERGLDYAVETIPDLVYGSWTNSGIEAVGSGSLDADFNAVTNRISTTGQNAGFLRLQIESSF